VRVVIRITQRTWTGDAVVEFPYDDAALEIIRSVPGRRWNRDARHWIIPHAEVRLAATRFHKAGFTVTIDGHPFDPAPSPPRADIGGAPLTAFFRILPVALRQPVYRALARVLHPDAGGDTALMQALNRANEETRP
jgi:hypothetical protein